MKLDDLLDIAEKEIEQLRYFKSGVSMKLDDLLDIAEKEIEQLRLCLLSVMGNLVALSAEAEEISQKLDKDSRLETLPEIRVAMQQSAARLDLAINRIDISLCDEEEG